GLRPGHHTPDRARSFVLEEGTISRLSCGRTMDQEAVGSRPDSVVVGMQRTCHSTGRRPFLLRGLPEGTALSGARSGIPGFANRRGTSCPSGGTEAPHSEQGASHVSQQRKESSSSSRPTHCSCARETGSTEPSGEWRRGSATARRNKRWLWLMG